jgi:sterol desaturase/sphingolipid hydroxylase (fatty acid hydroxylase superfamily)
MYMTLPTLLLIISTGLFLAWERVLPGRRLPNSAGWHVRALLINLIQLAITLLAGGLWLAVFSGESPIALANLNAPVLEGFIGWFVGTFVFYWWQRLRHLTGWWVIFHQGHHSASRIEVPTSFYRHPIEIFVNAFLSALILFPVLGASLTASVWYNFFAATGEYFYHANVKTPRWLRYVVQTPELHSIHHQYDVHSYNLSDLPIWDRIFGTYRDAVSFTSRCGFPDGAEQRLPEMLMFRDAYERSA